MFAISSVRVSAADNIVSVIKFVLNLIGQNFQFRPPIQSYNYAR